MGDQITYKSRLFAGIDVFRHLATNAFNVRQIFHY